MTEAIILNDQQIRDKIRRMAFQILESHSNATKIIIAGIAEGGFALARLIADQISRHDSIEVCLCEVNIDKNNPQNKISTSLKPIDYQNEHIILVDDVLNSGTTLIYSVRHFLDVPVKQFKTAVLVDRSHKKYPVKADFKGISLSTSIQETVEVELNGPNFKAVLK